MPPRRQHGHHRLGAGARFGQICRGDGARGHRLVNGCSIEIEGIDLMAALTRLAAIPDPHIAEPDKRDPRHGRLLVQLQR